MEEFVKNNKGYQILTDSGWESFDGIAFKGKKQTLILQTEKLFIVLTPDHEVFLDNGKKIEAKKLKPGNKIYTKFETQLVVSIKLNCDENVYDVINAGKNRRFYANDILCSNCEFIIFDETLINPVTLTEMAGIDPSYKQGQVRWYSKPQAGHTYAVALDPSLGTGGDFSAIQVLEMPSMKQIAEWQHNRTPIQQQIKVMAEICSYLAEFTTTEKIYYSVENNTLGEAALVSIAEYGEENIKGLFLSEPKRHGHVKQYRKGFTTTAKSKITACAKLKNLIETKRLILASKPLISQLKVFVASGGSFAAKVGEKDDLVMSLILTIRMANILREYDASLDDRLSDKDDEVILPMPFMMA